MKRKLSQNIKQTKIWYAFKKMYSKNRKSI